LISSELPEIIGLSDRIATFYKGRISGIVDGGDPDMREKVGGGIMGLGFLPSAKEA
jgi:ABC-type sugar transport system ATPase subunit